MLTALEGDPITAASFNRSITDGGRGLSAAERHKRIRMFHAEAAFAIGDDGALIGEAERRELGFRVHTEEAHEESRRELKETAASWAMTKAFSGSATCVDHSSNEYVFGISGTNQACYYRKMCMFAFKGTDESAEWCVGGAVVLSLRVVFARAA